MSVISMKQLLEAGVHFGHQTRRWNPKMGKYIFTERNGIYIIDLQKTVKKVEEAYKFVKEVAETGKPILFVGTKKQAQEAIKEEAERCGMFYVNERWLGGMLTNYKTIKTRINKLRELERMEEDGTFDVLPKKEVIKLRAEKEKLEKNLGGIKEMPELPGAMFVVDPRKENIAIQEAHRLGIPVVGIVDTNCEKNLGGIKEMPELPGAMFVVDPRKENIAIQEAHRLGIPVVGIVDTNCDPEELDFPIPGNDDAIRAVKLITGAMATAVIEGRQGAEEEIEEAEEVEVSEEN